MANGYDLHERLAVLAFRGWRWIRPVLRSTSSLRMANTYSVGGFALAIVAIPIALIAWPAVIAAGLGMLAAIGYGLDGYVKRVSMRVASGQDSNIRPLDFYNPPQSPDEGYRLVRPSDGARHSCTHTLTFRITRCSSRQKMI